MFPMNNKKKLNFFPNSTMVAKIIKTIFGYMLKIVLFQMMFTEHIFTEKIPYYPYEYKYKTTLATMLFRVPIMYNQLIKITVILCYAIITYMKYWIDKRFLKDEKSTPTRSHPMTTRLMAKNQVSTDLLRRTMNKFTEINNSLDSAPVNTINY